MELEQFDEYQSRLLQFAIAGFLNVSPDDVKIISAEESNSIDVIIELPAEYAEKILIAYLDDDPLFNEYMASFPVLAVSTIVENAKQKGGRGKGKFTHPMYTGNRLVGIGYTAKILGTTVSQVRIWTKSGSLRGMKRSGTWLYRMSEIKRFKEEIETGKLNETTIE
jgi:hypothetical protein